MIIKNKSFTLFSLVFVSLSYQNIQSVDSQAGSTSYLSNFLSSTTSAINNNINYYLQPIDPKSSQNKLITQENNNKPVADPTKTKTTVNTNSSQTIDYFDIQGKNISRTKIDARGNQILIINFNNDDTQTKITYNPDKSQTIDFFGTDHKSQSRVELDAQGNTTSEHTFNSEGTSLETKFNKDRTKTVIHFNNNNQSDMITEIDPQGNPTKSIQFNPDGTQSITTYNADKSQTIEQIDPQIHERIALTRIHPDGTKAIATEKLLTAWHEAGHAIARIHKDTLSLIKHITIQPKQLTSINGKSINTAGHVQTIQTYNVNKSVEEIENAIISYLCGAIGEQLVMLEKMLITSQDILEFLARTPYSEDIRMARRDAQEIVTMQSFQSFTPQQIEQKIDAIIIRLYKNAYEFLVKHKDELKKTAETLMKQETLTTDETYTLLNADMPLLASQEGPLPASLVQNYKYRGWQTKTNYAAVAA